MEGETCLDSIIDLLESLSISEGPGDVLEYQLGSLHWLEEEGPWRFQMEAMKFELRFLKMFMRGLEYWEDLEYDWHLHFAINTMMPKFSTLAKQLEADCEYILFLNQESQEMIWEAVSYDLEEAIQRFKPHIKDICIHLLGGASQCSTSTPSSPKNILDYQRHTASFIYLIQHNLESLRKYYLVAPVMMHQIVLIQLGIEDCRMLVGPAPSRLFNLVPQTLAWFNRISCLTCLYWIDGNDESVASTMEALLSGLLHKARPSNSSRVISFHFLHSKIDQPLASYLDFLLEDLVLPMQRDIDILQEDLIFMLSFLMDPPDVDSEDRDMIWAQIYAAVNKFPCLIHSIGFDVMNEDVCKAKLSDFLMKVAGLKAKVRELFIVFPYSSQYPSPTTNVTGFLNILVLNLRMLKEELHLIPSLKHPCESLLNELVFIGPLLKNMMELRHDGEHREILNVWSGIGNMVYNADYVSKLCFLSKSSVWYGMVALPKVIQHIKSIKIEIDRLVGVENMYTNKKLNHHDQMEETNALRPRGTSPEIERFSMGFREVERQIINDLTGGQNSLTIISISGLGGQGKTTLAKRIYNDPNVRCRFQKSEWCYVSKDCPVKELLAQILHVNTKVGSIVELKVPDLLEGVRKSLKGWRFLIVLDDIWDIDAWDQLKLAFPDDKNGSRILFTSRIRDLASQVKSNSIPHPLPLFSIEESWELMKKIVFSDNDCDEELVEIGKKLASCCEGLPLAVALTAGVLGRTAPNLDSWNEVAENLKTYLAQEGCGKVLELSYRYLPDYLKSCFLYFAAFQRGREVRAKRLKLLWISEGFCIQDGGMRFSEEDLAGEYLEYLVSQGLVVVTKRNSKGGIKRCNVHDLLYDLCLEKVKEDNFLHWADESVVDRDDECNIHSSSKLLKYNQTRLRIDERDSFIKSSHIVARRELPTSSLHSFLWSANSYASREVTLRCLSSFKVLTTLKLDLYVDEFPQVILSCICLRYLELDFQNDIKIIPPTIANLWSLITLIIASNNFGDITWLPLSMWDMESLKHVEIMDACPDLECFDPKNSSKSNIETLSTLYLDDDDSTTVEFLRRFPNLRRLKYVDGKRHIMELLSLVGSILIQLESLEVWEIKIFEGHPKSVVREFAKNENLTKLSLRGTRIPWSLLSEIGKQLPNLLVLKLRYNSCERSWKLEDGDFSKLIYLKLSSLPIEEFDISSCDDPLHSLEHLVLEYCQKLVEIPPVLGGINTLKTIRVIQCSKESKQLENSAMRILEEQRREFGNETLQVIIQ